MRCDVSSDTEVVNQYYHQHWLPDKVEKDFAKVLRIQPVHSSRVWSIIEQLVLFELQPLETKISQFFYPGPKWRIVIADSLPLDIRDVYSFNNYTGNPFCRYLYMSKYPYVATDSCIFGNIPFLFYFLFHYPVCIEWPICAVHATASDWTTTPPGIFSNFSSNSLSPPHRFQLCWNLVLWICEKWNCLRTTRMGKRWKACR